MYINTLLSLFSFGPLLFFYGLRRPYYFSLMAGIADGDGRWWARVADGLGEDGQRRRGSLIKWPDRAHTVSVPPTEGVGPWAMARRRSLRRLHPLPRVSCSPRGFFSLTPIATAGVRIRKLPLLSCRRGLALHPRHDKQEGEAWENKSQADRHARRYPADVPPALLEYRTHTSLFRSRTVEKPGDPQLVRRRNVWRPKCPSGVCCFGNCGTWDAGRV